MKKILKHFRILSVPIEDNPLATINLFIANCKDISEGDNSNGETLCVAALDNIINGEKLKAFFSKFGRIKCFNLIEKAYLSKNFKNFAYCIYLFYEEKNVIEIILAYTVNINEYFKSNIQVPYSIHLEKKKFIYYLKNYYDNHYNLFYGKKVIIKDILNLNKNKGKRLIDKDGFKIVQNVSDKPEFVNSIFSSTNEKISYLKKKKKVKIHENFYLFRKKDILGNSNNIFTKEKKKKA
ncbi:conserved Plasmodium protein, unknown function [Plasmodium malariae]|uniref:RRM domain-containing protein n=1 Tax=Plasmodium malariae TaxID=5858 RepID=A0A1D3SMM4_PLAMA|nr:conserved Plasmodium protein, unknown function [Plasmodium malariae]SCO93089.1 conserved Plasmodium protein, unknown function [Plasmodium malariae]